MPLHKGDINAVETGARRAAADRVKDARADGAIVGVNTRMEQLAAAMEVRLQAQEAQVMRLVSDLDSEREHGKLLEVQRGSNLFSFFFHAAASTHMPVPN